MLGKAVEIECAQKTILLFLFRGFISKSSLETDLNGVWIVVHSSRRNDLEFQHPVGV